MNWTQEQRDTIETTGRSILVSAAAGSGKTTVLVERIKRLLIDEGTDIDRFLITTFTNAAAAEMKERLEKALREEMKKPGADKAMLTRQLSKLPSASIGTFHSFAFDVIRQYFYLIDIEPGFNVADDVQVSIMKQEAVDKVFRRRYEDNSEDFRAFILKYSGSRNDRNLRESVLETCRTLASIHGGIEWAHAKADLLGGEHPLEAAGGYGYFARMIERGLNTARRHYGRAAELANGSGLPLCYAAASENAEKLEELAQKAGEAFACPEEELREALEKFKDQLTDFKAKSMAYKKDNADEQTAKVLKDEAKAGSDALSALRKEVYGRSFDELDAELHGVYADTLYYIDLVAEYLAELKTMKDAENIIEFDDALHYTIDILQHEEAAAELRERFEYIFVDEYQDSNYLQEEIINRIAREDNLFMVGDIKQCIYKFRLAEPELFRDRALRFAEEETSGLLLHISSNFRSKQSVTEAVNCVFRAVMPDYDSSAELHCTAGEEHTGFPPRIHLIVNGAFEDDAPDKNDAEGAVVAGIIRERLGTEVYDTKKKCMRPLTLRDFAVIVRNNAEVEALERYLINEGIAAYGESGGKYFDTVEVQVFLNLLKIIENMRQDVPLISAMRSIVFGFTVRELAQIRIACREGSFSDAVLAYAAPAEDASRPAETPGAAEVPGPAEAPEDPGVPGSSGSPEDPLREKIRAMIRTVDLWKEISRTVPLEDLMKEILYGTGYYDYCSGLPVGTQRISNLRLIIDKASRFEEMSHSGLYGFLRYIESMQSSDKTDSEAKTISESENVVRVMSVHKSKGLEFPVVIFANAAKQTERADSSGQIKIHRAHGIGLPIVNRQEHWRRTSMLQKMIAASSLEEKIEEEIRILYVALTRAKDGLEIVGTVKEMEKLEGGVSTKTFLEMLYEPLMSMEDTELILYEDADQLGQSQVMRRHTPEQLYSLAEAFNNPDLAELADARLSFEYPHQAEMQIKQKYSVTELNKAMGAGAGGAAGAAADAGAGAGADDTGATGAVVGTDAAHADALETALPEVEAFDPEGAHRTSRGLTASSGFTAADRGTLMHLLMEKTEFAALAGVAAPEVLDRVQETADILLATDIISPEEYDTLSIDKAAAFFGSDIGHRAAEAAAAERLWKEKEFIYSMDMAGDTSTIVQGVIDCFFEEEGSLILVDYKNSYMGAGRTEDDIRQTYAGQIDLYRQALEAATGKPVKEAYLFLFDTGKFIEM